MWSAFERSLRGTAGAPNSTAKPQAPVAANTNHGEPAAEARKKKSVSWGDSEAEGEPVAASTTESSSDIRGGDDNAKGSSSSTTSATVGASAGGANASFTGLQEQGLDHLRVPSARAVGARADHRESNSNATTGGRSSATDLHTASTASSARKRVGEAPGIQAGAVRVRTPAKPKRQRSALTPATASTASSRAAVVSAAGKSAAGGAGEEDRGSRTSPRKYLRKGGGITAPAVSPAKRTSLRASRPSADSQRRSAAVGVTISPPRSGRRRSGSPRLAHRSSSAGMALRNVAGGNAEGAEYLDANEEEDGDVSLLSAGGSSVSPSPLRSPRASSIHCGGSPRAQGFPPRSPRVSGERFVAPPSPSSAASTSFVSSSFTSSDRILEEDEENDDDDEQDDFLPAVTRQSLESRLAAASAAHRTSVESFKNNPQLAGSPFSTSTTVRRRSTSLIHVGGEPGSSILSEEVSEESITVEGGGCLCQHREGCAIGKGGTGLGSWLGDADEKGGSVEVRDRLEELQGMVAALEQEKVNLNMALVPMEERLASKEKAWEAERRELTFKTEDNSKSLRAAEERCRELEKMKSEMEEGRHALDAELRRLRSEIEQKESKTAESFWQRTVAADREKTRLETALDQAQARAATLAKEKAELDAEILPIKSEAASLRFRFNEAEKVASRVLTAEEAVRFSKAQLEVMRAEFVATSAQLTAMQTELAEQKARSRVQLEEKEKKAGLEVASFREEINRLRTTILDQADRVVEASMPREASVSPKKQGLDAAITDEGQALLPAQAIGVSSEAARIRHQELTTLRTELETERKKSGNLQKMVEELEDARRRMHNTIQELRGSVRVFVRARPFLASDGEDASSQGEATVRCGADQCSVAVCPSDAPSRAISCAFDHVFGGHASQEDVFKEVSGFVQSALDGFKVCLFSYGQTGSGKTHTMTGSGSGRMRGVIPRSVEHILARVAELQEGQWSYTVEASFMEIYNEELRDLLGGYGEDTDGDISMKKAGGARQQQGIITRSSHNAATNSKKLAIRKVPDGGTEVAGLTKFPIDTGDENRGLAELEEIMAVAQRARSVASTAMNAQSSRSHSVFTLWLAGTDISTGTTLKGVLHLVDLAGSERLDRSGVGNDAQRLRETQSINKSLSCLADVFSALSAKSSHIPFRNSKLTYLMQDCLSGDGKALMFVNLSPTAASANETVCSLRFANQVSQVELGKAQRQLSLGKPVASRNGGGGGGRPPSGSSPTSPVPARGSRASGSSNIPGSPGRSRTSSLSLSGPPASPGRSRSGSITVSVPKSPGHAKISKSLPRTASNASTATTVISPRTSCGSTGGGSFWGRSSLTGRSSVGAGAGNRRKSSAGGPSSPVRPGSSSSSRLSISARARTSASSTAGPPPSPSGPVRNGGFSREGSRRASKPGPARSASTSGAATGTSRKGSVGGGIRPPSSRAPRRSVERRGSGSISPRPGKSSVPGAAGAGTGGAPGGRRSVSGSVRPSSAISRGEGAVVSPRPDDDLQKRPRLST